MRLIQILFVSATIFSVESVSAGSLSFSSNTYSVSENTATLTITVNRAGSTGSAASVTVVSVNATATAGSDFTAVSQALTWGAGDAAAKTFAVALIDDNIVEGLEAFTLKFTSPVGDGTGGDAVVSVADFEEGSFQFASAYFSDNEDSLALIARINRVSGTDGAASVKVKSSAGAPAASNTLDYTDVDTTVSFAAGEFSKTVSIPLKNDDIAEFSEWIKITLSNAVGASLGTPVVANAEIKDTDQDFTSELQLITKKIVNVEQSKLLDLKQKSLLDASKSVLDLVNAIPIFTLTELVAGQDTDGLLTIDVESDRIYLRPTSIKKAAAGAPATILHRDDQSAQFVTSQGWVLEGQPALKGISVLQKGLAEIFLPKLVITEYGNITIQVDQGAPPFERDADDNVVVNYRFYDRWNLRPSMIASVANSDKEGFSTIPHPADAGEVMVSVVYDDGGKYRQQLLSSAPINGPELLQTLTSKGVDRCAVISGSCVLSVANPMQVEGGLVVFDMAYFVPSGVDTVTVTIFPDYQIRKVPNFKSTMVGFRETKDLNSDGSADYRMTYANGEEQDFFFVSAMLK